MICIERGRHELVHLFADLALDEIRRVTVAAKELIQLFVADPCQHAGTGDLVAIQVQDRQHRAVCCRVQELVGVPACGQRPRFGFAVSDDAARSDPDCRRPRHRRARAHNPVRRLRGSSRASPARRGSECHQGKRIVEESLHSLFVRGDVGIDLAVRSFEIGVCDQPGPAMARTGDVDHVQVVFFDDSVEMDVNEIQPGRCAPMAEKARLDVFLVAASSAVGCRRDRSGRPRDSWQRANTH